MLVPTNVKVRTGLDDRTPLRICKLSKVSDAIMFMDWLKIWTSECLFSPLNYAVSVCIVQEHLPLCSSERWEQWVPGLSAKREHYLLDPSVILLCAFPFGCVPDRSPCSISWSPPGARLWHLSLISSSLWWICHQREILDYFLTLQWIVMHSEAKLIPWRSNKASSSLCTYHSICLITCDLLPCLLVMCFIVCRKAGTQLFHRSS